MGVTVVEAVQWVSEATLWTPWMHMGSLTAITESRLIVIDSRHFQDIVAQFDHPDFDPRVYADEFVDALNSSKEEITDLPLKFQSDEIGIMIKQVTHRFTHTIKKRTTHFSQT